MASQLGRLTAKVQKSRSPYFPAASLQGHQQITDAYLLALCASRGGRLATFDTAIGAIAANPQLVTNIPV